MVESNQCLQQSSHDCQMMDFVGQLIDERLQPLHLLAAAEVLPSQGGVDGLNDVTGISVSARISRKKPDSADLGFHRAAISIRGVMRPQQGRRRLP